MPNPTVPEMVADVTMWIEALNTTGKVLALKSTLVKQVETVKTVAAKADAIASDKESVLNFQRSMGSVCHSGDAVLAQGNSLGVAESEMDNSLQVATSSESSGLEVVQDCITKLDALLGSAQSFNEKLDSFQGCCNRAVEICTRLVEEFEQSKTSVQQAAADEKLKIALGAAGAAVLGIASFFTFGSSLPAAVAVLAGAAYSAKSYFEAREFEKDAGKLKSLVNSLTSCMQELSKASGQLTEAGEVTDEIHRAVACVIQNYRERRELLERDSRLEEENRQLRQRENEQQERIRQLEEQLRRQRSNEKE